MNMNPTVTTHAKQDFEFHLHLTMGEAAVLMGMFAYGAEPLVKEALAKGSAIKENVPDPAPIMDALYRKVRHDLEHEWSRCMELRRVFYNPKQFVITAKPKNTESPTP